MPGHWRCQTGVRGRKGQSDSLVSRSIEGRRLAMRSVNPLHNMNFEVCPFLAPASGKNLRNNDARPRAKLAYAHSMRNLRANDPPYAEL